jgi:phage baseplate assembly protein W
MASIYLDNLVKPRETNSPYSLPSKETTQKQSVYTDLHLDLILKEKIGVGINAQNSNDIVVDNDSDAIRNSLYNIFTTKPGQKLLTPSFGSNLEQYLFESVNEINAKIIGNNILKVISTFEPRIDVLKIQVTPVADQLTYYVTFSYKLLNTNQDKSFQIKLQSRDNITIL